MSVIVTLKKGEGRTVKAGGMWIYDNEIESVLGSYENGDVVLVHDFDGYPMGVGFINDHSKIRVRMLSRDENTVIDEAFWMKRVKRAWEYRKKVVDTSSCRLIFAEADFFPGLVVDKFADVLVVQSNALGIDRWKLVIVGCIKQCLEEDGVHIRGVYERSDAKVRTQEGMERIKGFIGEPFNTNVEIVENGVLYVVDIKEGQKTGFFLDQKYNRAAVGRLCQDADVLDCFTHTNARMNDLQGIVNFACGDVFDLLPDFEKKGKQFDVVILDPPAFTKSRNSVKNAVKGYREINMRALKLVKDGGYLATCSCSHFMTYELFTETIRQAAKSAHKRLRQVEYRTQAPDHPILWAADESYYLKFYIFQVVEEM